MIANDSAVSAMTDFLQKATTTLEENQKITVGVWILENRFKWKLNRGLSFFDYPSGGFSL